MKKIEFGQNIDTSESKLPTLWLTHTHTHTNKQTTNTNLVVSLLKKNLHVISMLTITKEVNMRMKGC